MVNYEKGKIYQLSTPHSTLIYIGSTTKKYLSQRLVTHNKNYKTWKAGKCKGKVTACELFDLGDVEITLLELYPCTSKDELHAREGEWIRENKDICINKRNGMGLARKEQFANYRANNKAKILQKITCECGQIYTAANKQRHISRKYHQNYLLTK